MLGETGLSDRAPDRGDDNTRHPSMIENGRLSGSGRGEDTLRVAVLGRREREEEEEGEKEEGEGLGMDDSGVWEERGDEVCP